MKKIVIGIVLAAILGLLARGIQRSISASNQKVVSIPELQQEMGIPVNIEPAVRRSLEETRIYSGTIKGKDQADATAKVMERLDQITVRVGERVQKGAVVAKLNRENPNARYQQARLALENARKEFERAEALFREGAISQRDRDNAELQFNLSKEDFETASRLLDVVSPISGIVTELFQDPGVTVAPGTPIVRIASLGTVELEAKVSEADILDMRRNQKAEIVITGTPRQFVGTVDRISLSADPEDRNFRVWISIDNREGILRPGMFATARIVIRESDSTLVVAKDSIVKEGNEEFVFIINANNTAERRTILTGVSDERFIEVQNGINEGELVVILGQNKLEGGEKVRIIDSVQ